MPTRELTIQLTEDQQKQIKNAMGKTVTELRIDPDQLSQKDLEKAAGGSPRDAASGLP